eukprot:jgi/Botrbrau1/7346/Bobra.247_3s0039.1
MASGSDKWMYLRCLKSDTEGLNVLKQHISSSTLRLHMCQQVRYHVVGTPQSDDVFVFATPENPRHSIGAEATDDGRYLLINFQQGTDPNNTVWVVDLSQVPKSGKTGALDFSGFKFAGGSKELPIQKLVDDFSASWGVLHTNGSTFWIQTNLHAPNYRQEPPPDYWYIHEKIGIFTLKVADQVATNYPKSNLKESSSLVIGIYEEDMVRRVIRGDISEKRHPSTWTDLLPETEDLLQGVAVIKGGKMLVEYLHNVASLLQLRELDTGALIRNLPSGMGTIGGLSGNIDNSEVFWSYGSFTEPGTTYRDVQVTKLQHPRWTLSCGRTTDVSGWEAQEYQTVQEWATSKDGTKIPIFITHHKDTKLDGTNPTILYAYGGFAISTTPGFSTSRAAFLKGFRGVYAVATIRGGGEFGTGWHMAGQLHNKQNGFDDFISAAEYLINQNYTSPSKLVINGQCVPNIDKILVKVPLNPCLRPGLFGAVLVDVGVADMFRFFNFTIGHAWIPEYGDPLNSTDFKYMMKWSPLHNVRVPQLGTRQYPAMLLSTGDHDDRVAPLHSFKLISTLQYTLAGYADSPQRNPLLLRVETRAGHGAGKPTSAVIESKADEYAYALFALYFLKRTGI